MERDDLEFAVEVCRRLTSQHPEKVEFLETLGSLLSRLGRLDEAGTCFERAVELAPEQTAAWFGLGVVQRGQGNLQKAQSHFERAMILDPGHEGARQALAELASPPGSAASEEMNSVTAAANLVAAIVKEGKSEDGHWTGGLNGQLALSRLLIGRPAYHKAVAVLLAQEAALIRKFDTIHRIVRDYESSRPLLDGEIAYGRLIKLELERSSGLGSAARLYQLATQFDPDQGLVEYSLGAALSESGADEQPSCHFRCAAELAPDLEPYVIMLEAAASEREGADKDAARLYLQAAERLTSLGRLHATVASCLRRSGKIEAALDHYEKAISCSRFFPPEFWAVDTSLSDRGREYLWHFNETQMPDTGA